MRMVYRYMVILCLFFIVPDTLRADGEDVLERMISLPKMKGTVYSLLGNISQQSGYLFIYDTRVRDNILKSKEQKNIQPTKGGHKMVTCQNYVSLFYRQITSCPSDGGIS